MLYIFTQRELVNMLLMKSVLSHGVGRRREGQDEMKYTHIHIDNLNSYDLTIERLPVLSSSGSWKMVRRIILVYGVLLKGMHGYYSSNVCIHIVITCLREIFRSM